MDSTNKYLEEVRHPDDESKEPELLAAELMTFTSSLTSSDIKNKGEYRRLFNAQALFGGGRQVAILHGNEEYMLRITKQGKLILTK